MPHSDTHGSTPARGSPWLFAACHVLHRLLVPRHPPNALLALKNTDPTDNSRRRPDQHPPCTGASHTRTNLAVSRSNRPCHQQARTQHNTRDHAGSSPTPSQTPLNVSTRSQAATQVPPRTCRSDNTTKARPATHQNLIHPDKDHNATRPNHRPGRRPLTTAPPLCARDRGTAETWISLRQDPARTPHPNMVEAIGFEPTTPCLQSRCSPS